MKSERWGSLAICVGLMLFGFVVGGIAGLSKTPVAAGLLTSLFGFVGGVLLSFAGFTIVDKQGEEKPRVDTLRLGAALAMFSVGLGGGVVSGIVARFRIPALVEPAAETRTEPEKDKEKDKDKPTPPKKPSLYRFGLEAEEASFCAGVAGELARNEYAADPKLAASRVVQLHKILCAPAR